MKRSHAKTERTMKMSGTDWEQYFPVIEEKKRLCWISRTTMCGLNPMTI